MNKILSPDTNAPFTPNPEGVAELKAIYDQKANIQADATANWQQHAGVLDKVRYAFTGGVSQELHAKLDGTYKQPEAAPKFSWLERAKNAIGGIGNSISAKVEGAMEYAKNAINNIREGVQSKVANVLKSADNGSANIARAANKTVAGVVLAAQVAGCGPTGLNSETSDNYQLNQDYLRQINSYNDAEALPDFELDYSLSESPKPSSSAPARATITRPTPVSKPAVAVDTKSKPKVETSAPPKPAIAVSSVPKPKKQPTPIAATTPFVTKSETPKYNNIAFAGKLSTSKMSLEKAQEIWGYIIRRDIECGDTLFSLTSVIDPNQYSLDHNSFANSGHNAKSTGFTGLNLKYTSPRDPTSESGTAINPAPPQVKTTSSITNRSLASNKRQSDILEISKELSPPPSSKFKAKMRTKFDASGRVNLGKPSFEIDEKGNHWQVTETDMGLVFKNISPTINKTPVLTNLAPSDTFKNTIEAKFKDLEEAGIAVQLQLRDPKTGYIWIAKKTKRFGIIYELISTEVEPLTPPHRSPLQAQHELTPIQ